MLMETLKIAWANLRIEYAGIVDNLITPYPNSEYKNMRAAIAKYNSTLQEQLLDSVTSEIPRWNWRSQSDFKWSKKSLV
jgi:hypothetical protein